MFEINVLESCDEGNCKKMSWLPESLLEMHFHRAIIKKYEKKFGIKFLRLLKPSLQREAWVGFDQGWTKSDLSEQDLFNQLRSVISTGRNQLSKFYFGEFLQFKIVQEVTRKSSSLPSGFSTPYYRSALSLKPNKTTHISQHETLVRLTKIKGASVYYACPMIFDLDELWDKPNLKLLRFVDVTTAPSGWLTNEHHYLAFQSRTTSVPMWCSDPVEGRAFSEEERWESENHPRELSGEQAISLINNVTEVFNNENNQGLIQGELFPRLVRYLLTSMCLYEFTD